VLLVHDPKSEAQFVANGFLGVKRFAFMYNDFIIVGPKADPRPTSPARENVIDAMKKIASSGALFASRGRRQRHQQGPSFSPLEGRPGIDPKPGSGKMVS